MNSEKYHELTGVDKQWDRITQHGSVLSRYICDHDNNSLQQAEHRLNWAFAFRIGIVKKWLIVDIEGEGWRICRPPVNGNNPETEEKSLQSLQDNITSKVYSGRFESLTFSLIRLELCILSP